MAASTEKNDVGDTRATIVVGCGWGANKFFAAISAGKQRRVSLSGKGV